ncbi:15807_t:CDS:2, partial [Acaulospora colombiana]
AKLDHTTLECYQRVTRQVNTREQERPGKGKGMRPDDIPVERTLSLPRYLFLSNEPWLYQELEPRDGCSRGAVQKANECSRDEVNVEVIAIDAFHLPISGIERLISSREGACPQSSPVERTMFASNHRTLYFGQHASPGRAVHLGRHSLLQAVSTPPSASALFAKLSKGVYDVDDPGLLRVSHRT